MQTAALAHALVADDSDQIFAIALLLFAATTGLVRQYVAARRKVRAGSTQHAEPSVVQAATSCKDD